MSDDEDERRLLLMGRTGVGKSRTGNIIFNESVFLSELSSSSVTRECQTHTDGVNNRRVTVIDTPDFVYSTNTRDDLNSQLKRALDLCAPGAHAVLLLLPLNTFTQQELDYVTGFEQKFGEEVLRYTIVLFINANKTHKRTLKEMIRKNNRLSGLINRCGQRYLEFNISDLSNRPQVSQLMEKIDTLVFNNTNTCYTPEMLLENERRDEKRKTREISEEHHEDLERVRQEMMRQEEELEQAIQNPALIRKDAEQLEQEEREKDKTKKTQLITKLKWKLPQNCGYLWLLIVFLLFVSTLVWVAQWLSG
ncbi:GTPase IMAP family member 4-like [Triplophysa rosa]|uniref:GTPase IMAP family member 4-like n=1 Tax=Triplophysa rosa TaxID=992332 RepID=UPI002545E2CE|nr:GTPase IMAP family member 4-like [Triplophysa rosa]